MSGRIVYHKRVGELPNRVMHWIRKPVAELRYALAGPDGSGEQVKGLDRAELVSLLVERFLDDCEETVETDD